MALGEGRRREWGWSRSGGREQDGKKRGGSSGVRGNLRRRTIGRALPIDEEGSAK